MGQYAKTIKTEHTPRFTTIEPILAVQHVSDATFYYGEAIDMEQSSCYNQFMKRQNKDTIHWVPTDSLEFDRSPKNKAIFRKILFPISGSACRLSRHHIPHFIYLYGGAPWNH